MYHQKGGCHFSFISKKQPKCISVQTEKKKRAAVSFSRMCRSKIFAVEITKNPENPL